MNDPVKAQELLSLLIDENEEIKDTEAFKKEITDESAISKQNLLTMTNDIKDAIKEGSAQDVALYLESLLEDDVLSAGDSDEDDSDEDFDDEECNSCDDCCGCDSGCADKSCCGGVNLFSNIEKDQNKTTH